MTMGFYEIGTETAEKLMHPDEWQDWASSLIGDPDFIGLDAPDPYNFDDWREWAQLFFLTQELGTALEQ